jgi:hypothetical protein
MNKEPLGLITRAAAVELAVTLQMRARQAAPVSSSSR